MDSCAKISIRVLGVACIAAAPLAAQVPTNYVVDIEPIPAPASVTHTEIARVVPFHGRSVVLQWGGELQLAYAPTVHELNVSLASNVSSFAILPGGAGSDRDEIVVADGVGLYTLRYTTGSSDPYFAVTSLSGTSSCAGASGLACGDWNHDGTFDVAAVSAARDRIYVLNKGTNGYAVTHFDPLYGGVREIAALDWDADGDAELAVLSDWGTEVYDTNGTQLFQRVSLYGSDHVMTVLHSPSAKDAVAVVQRGMNGTNRLLAVHRSGGTDTAVNLSNIGIVGISAGDLDLDTDSDLALSLEGSTRYLRPMYDSGTTPHFVVVNQPPQLPLGDGNPTPIHCNPAIGDLNDDQRADMAMGIEAGSGVVFDTQVAWHAANGWSTLVSPAAPFDGYGVLFGADTWNTETGDNVETELTISNTWYSPTFPQDSLEVILWTQSYNATSGLSSTVGGVAKHYVFSLPPGFIDNSSKMKIGFELPSLADNQGGYSFPFHRIQYVEVRPVTYNPSTHAITNPLETHIGGFALESSGTGGVITLPYLRTRAGACEACELPADVTSQDMAGSTRYVGGFVPQANIPPTPPHVLPTIGEPIPLTGVQFGG